ncbi:MAG: zinc ribbon domain-containing protein [Bacteroidales bacterium]|nr:zinc ribbon domain-containing protein [Bacteroidales bacterium]
MPTYDYVCDACQHAFEEWQSFKDEPLTKCPACKKKKLRRLFGGGAAIIFKGSGFYETDYRKDSYKAAEKADKEAQTKADTPSESKTTTSTEGKSESATPKASAQESGSGRSSKTKKADKS